MLLNDDTTYMTASAPQDGSCEQLEEEDIATLQSSLALCIETLLQYARLMSWYTSSLSRTGGCIVVYEVHVPRCFRLEICFMFALVALFVCFSFAPAPLDRDFLHINSINLFTSIFTRHQFFVHPAVLLSST